ncbi:MAG: hypothetical protein ACLFVT_00255 [Syntrophobacteria bacterium]
MQDDSADQRSKEKEIEQPGSEDFDFQLDDIDEEIIDLVDIVDEDSLVSDERALESSESPDEDEVFSLEDFGVEEQPGDEAPGTVEAVGEDGQFAAESLDATEGEIEAMLAEEEPAADTMAAEDAGGEVDRETDEALAQLFSSNEMDVSEFLEESAHAGEAAEEGPVAEAPPVEEEEFSEDLLADLEAEADGAEGRTFEETPVPGLEGAGDVTASLEVEDQADAARTGPSEALGPAATEELAALVSAEVEAVVIRLVEERLPAIAERVILQEIEKIKASMEQEQ